MGCPSQKPPSIPPCLGLAPTTRDTRHAAARGKQVLDIPSDCIGYVTGSRRAALGGMEDRGDRRRLGRRGVGELRIDGVSKVGSGRKRRRLALVEFSATDQLTDSKIRVAQWIHIHSILLSKQMFQVHFQNGFQCIEAIRKLLSRCPGMERKVRLLF